MPDAKWFVDTVESIRKNCVKLFFLAAADSVHSHRWISYFHQNGHDVFWASLTLSSKPIPSGINFYYLGGRTLNPLVLFLQVCKLRKIISKVSPDVLHVHSVGTYGLLAALTRFRPLIATAWGSDVLLCAKSVIKRPLVKWVLSVADLITCDAYHMLDAISMYGIDQSKVKLIYFGVEPNVFSPGEKNRDVLEKWGASGKKVVISLRNLEPIYNIETLLRAVPEVVSKFDSVRFVVGGGGSAAGDLHGLAESLGVSRFVHFMGKYAHDELPGYLRTADIYVSTSLSDAGIAASTAEAMSVGLPVVVSDSGENAKWIHDGENGFLFPVEDSKCLAKTILKLLQNPTLRLKISGPARETILSRNNYSCEMGKMNSLYGHFAMRNRSADVSIS